jgi:hypothetical protein
MADKACHVLCSATRVGLIQALGRRNTVQSLAKFVKELTGPAWFCCSVAIVGLLCSLYAWLPLPMPPQNLPIYLVLAAMAAGVIAFATLSGHHIISWEHRKAAQPKVRLPRVFWLAAFGSLVYFLAVFFGAYIIYPHGIDLGPWVNLRISSAATLFFGISTLGFTQWAGLRVRALQSAP